MPAKESERNLKTPPFQGRICSRPDQDLARSYPALYRRVVELRAPLGDRHYQVADRLGCDFVAQILRRFCFYLTG